MSAHRREDWEALGLKSSQALTLVRHVRNRVNLSRPEEWIKEVESRAIAEFVGYQSAKSLTTSGQALRECLIVACARFGARPEWFFTDEDNGEVDETSARELRADVAHYRIMHGLDGEDE